MVHVHQSVSVTLVLVVHDLAEVVDGSYMGSVEEGFV